MMTDRKDIKPVEPIEEAPEESYEESSEESEDASEKSSEQSIDAIEILDDDSSIDVEKQWASTSNSSSIAKYDLLAAYGSEVQRFPLLNREQEHALAVRLYDDGDQDAGKMLVQSNLRLVMKIAYEYRRAYHHLLDLIQEGNIGLMQAVQKYDPHRGVKLSTYAAWWIRAYMLRFIINNWRLVKIGTTRAQRKLFFNLNKEKQRLEQQGFAPEPKLIAEKLDVSESDVLEMEARLSGSDASLDVPVFDDSEAETRVSNVRSAEKLRPDVIAEDNELKDLLHENLKGFGETLSGRDFEIFELRLLSHTPLTLQELGDRYGISRERARQLEKRILNRLKTYLETQMGNAIDTIKSDMLD